MKRNLSVLAFILIAVGLLSCSDDGNDSSLNPSSVLFSVTVHDSLGNPVPGLRIGSINHSLSPKASSLKPCPDTPINFSLPEATDYVLTIYNYCDMTVRVFSGYADAGVYTIMWDGTDANGDFVPGGFYRMRLVAGPFDDQHWFIYDWGSDPYHTILGTLNADGHFTIDDMTLFPGLIPDPPIEFYSDTVTIHISDPDFPDDFYMKKVALSPDGNSFTFIYDSLGLPTSRAIPER